MSLNNFLKGQKKKVIKKQKDSMFICDRALIPYLEKAIKRGAMKEPEISEYCKKHPLNGDFTLSLLLLSSRRFIKEIFREFLLEIGFPESAVISVKRYPKDQGDGQFLMQIDEKFFHLQIHSDNFLNSLDIVNESGSEIRFKNWDDQFDLTLLDTEEELNSFSQLTQKFCPSSYECEKSTETERISVSVCYLDDFKRKKLIEETEKSITEIVKHFNKAESSIDILYTTIKKVLNGEAVKDFSIRFSKKVRENNQEVWVDTDCAVNENGVITLFRITKSGRTIEVDDFKAWTNQKPSFAFQVDPSFNISLQFPNIPSKKELFGVLSQFDALSEYEQAEQEAKEVIRLINTL